MFKALSKQKAACLQEITLLAVQIQQLILIYFPAQLQQQSPENSSITMEPEKQYKVMYLPIERGCNWTMVKQL